MQDPSLHATASANPEKVAPLILFSDEAGSSASGGEALVARLSGLRLQIGDEFSAFIPPAVLCKTTPKFGFVAPYLVRLMRKIEQHFGSGAVLVFDVFHPLVSLALIARRYTGLRYFLSCPTARIDTSPLLYALAASAEGFVTASEEARGRLKQVYVGPSRYYASLAQVADAVAEQQMEQGESAQIVEGKMATADESTPLKVLIVAYYAGDCSTVGAFRPNYWFDTMAELSDGTVEVQIASAMPKVEAPAGAYHHVPDQHGLAWWGETGTLNAAAMAAMKAEKALPRYFDRFGFYWEKALQDYFDASAEAYDVVIVTGGPFGYLGFGSYAKARWGAKVILDYRDPYSRNPRLIPDPAHKAAIEQRELEYNKGIDLLLSVNQACVDKLLGDGAKAVIPNGFDDRLVRRITPTKLEGEGVNFVHAGSWRPGAEMAPTALLGALANTTARLHHIGTLGNLSPEDVSSDKLVYHGTKPYEETLSFVAGGDCGVVYNHADPWATSTKVFDYLAFGMEILIITPDGEPKGELAKMTEDLQGIYWLKNDRESLQEFVASYQPSATRNPDAMRFSRQASTRQLIRHIQDLAGR